MSTGDDTEAADGDNGGFPSPVASATYRALSLGEALASTDPPAPTCATGGCGACPSSVVEAAHTQPTAFCAHCAEAELSRYQTAREYPLSAVADPGLDTAIEQVEESPNGAGYELAPEEVSPETTEMWIRGRNTHTEAGEQETVVDLSETR